VLLLARFNGNGLAAAKTALFPIMPKTGLPEKYTSLTLRLNIAIRKGGYPFPTGRGRRTSHKAPSAKFNHGNFAEISAGVLKIQHNDISLSRKASLCCTPCRALRATN
jgi:hypothetical protein